MSATRRVLLICGLALAYTDSTPPARAPRTFRMGFSAIPPRADQTVALQSLNLWTSGHADAAIMHVSVPYAALFSGLRTASARPVLVVEGGGVVDAALRAKPALAAWEEVFARPFAP